MWRERASPLHNNIEDAFASIEIGTRLFRLGRDDQQHFHRGGLPILHSGPELPLLQSMKKELCFSQLRRKDDCQLLEPSGRVDEAMDHNGISICVRIDAGPRHIVWPWRIRTA